MRIKGQNLGKAMGLIYKTIEAENMDDDFGCAMGAPMGELAHIINRGRAKQYRKLRRQIKAITGLKYRVFCDEIEKRTSGKWAYNHQVGILLSIRQENLVPEWIRSCSYY
jgi:hypothetical protein